MDILRRNAELLHQSAPNPYAHQHSKPRLSYGPSPDAMMRRLTRMDSANASNRAESIRPSVRKRVSQLHANHKRRDKHEQHEDFGVEVD